ncbi:MAG: AbrB/MazE/SpoVT family DNA-binding domain-containing protein [Gammaproteobacteria bacterium]|nr:AbrB/MazE/SpoVT family DNA-binding domain-containing protein [Gammaproteobacteria bacterium]
MLTKVFKSGNSMAVRIPKELAFVDPSQEVEIERVGDSLVLRPVVRDSLADLGEVLSLFSDEFMAEEREFESEYERDWVIEGKR